MNRFTINLPSTIQYVLKVLKDSGFEAYVVGGCVRDTFLGTEPKDWDITTSASPAEVKELFQKYGQIDTGLKHGTVMVVINKEMVEITTFRIDGDYSDGRRPDQVSFTSNVVEDLSRRDFTINACAASESLLIDPFHGQEDAKNHLIRCVGEPDLRFQEDSLRILRGIRFSSVLGFKVEEKTREAMLANNYLLKNVSQERITTEFCKTLLGTNVKSALSEFKAIIAYLIPEIEPTIGFQQNNPYHSYDVYEHSILATEMIEPDIILRSCAFFHDIGKPSCYSIDENGIGHFYGHADISSQMTSLILTRMKYPASNIQRITELIKYHDVDIAASTKGIKRFLNKIGKGQFRKLLSLKKADILAQNPQMRNSRIEKINLIEDILNDVIRQNACTALSDLAISGKDLLELGVPQGKYIGEILNQLLNFVIEEEIENSRADLLNKAKVLALPFI